MCLGMLHLKPLCCHIYFSYRPDCASLLTASTWGIAAVTACPACGTSFCWPSHSPLTALGLSWERKCTSKRAVRSEIPSSAEISKSRSRLTTLEEFYFSIPLGSSHHRYDNRILWVECSVTLSDMQEIVKEERSS